MPGKRPLGLPGFVAVGILALAGCNEAREREEPPVVFADVDPILEAKCVECHSGPAWRKPTTDSRTTSRRFGAFRIPRGISPRRCRWMPERRRSWPRWSEPDHADLLDADETNVLTTWVVRRRGSRRVAARIRASWIDPRADEWHGELFERDRLAADRRCGTLRCVRSMSFGFAPTWRGGAQAPTGRHRLHRLP